MSDQNKQNQQDNQPTFENPLDNQEQGQDNVLQEAQEVVDALDKQNPLSVEGQESENAQESEKLAAEQGDDNNNNDK